MNYKKSIGADLDTTINMYYMRKLHEYSRNGYDISGNAEIKELLTKVTFSNIRIEDEDISLTILIKNGENLIISDDFILVNYLESENDYNPRLIKPKFIRLISNGCSIKDKLRVAGIHDSRNEFEEWIDEIDLFSYILNLGVYNR